MLTLTHKDGSSQSQLTKTFRSVVRVCQLKIEGISRSKSEYLLDGITNEILLQDTQAADESQLRKRGRIPVYMEPPKILRANKSYN